MDYNEYLTIEIAKASGVVTALYALQAAADTSEAPKKKAPAKKKAVEKPAEGDAGLDLTLEEAAPKKEAAPTEKEAPATFTHIERVEALQDQYPMGTYNPVPAYLHPLKYLPEDSQKMYLSSIPIKYVDAALLNFSTAAASEDGLDSQMLAFICEDYAGSDHDWDITTGTDGEAVGRMIDVLGRELWDLVRGATDKRTGAMDFQKMTREVATNVSA